MASLRFLRSQLSGCLGFLCLVLMMFRDGLHRRAHGRADELLLVVLCPVQCCLPRDIRFVDYRRYMALPQFIGFLGVLEIRQMSRELEEAAEIALLLL